MSTSYEISLGTADAPVVSTGVSEQLRAIHMDTSASSVLDEPKLNEDGSDTQIVAVVEGFWYVAVEVLLRCTSDTSASWCI